MSLATSLRRWFFGSALYPAVVRLRGEGSVFDRQRELERLQWLEAAELERWQSSRLARILQHSADHVPLYRERWGKLQFDSITARTQLTDLPLLEKSDLQARSNQLVADGLRYRVSIKTTGGSTGQAVTLRKDRAATAAEMAASWLGYGWFGIQRGDKGVRFWGTPTAAKRRLRFAAADLAMNRMRFSAFAFDQADLDRYWEACVKFCPTYFYGYVSMLEQLARHVLKRKAQPLPHLKAVITTSEVLTEAQREVIERAFGAPVQNEYGCGEVGPIAYECPHGSLHVMSPNHVVELLDGDGQEVPVGGTGEVVVTDLNNRAMPLVRYRVGDFGVRGPACSCGRSFPTLDRIWGRQYDFLLAPDGRRYHGEFVMYLFEDLRSDGVQIDAFRVVQEGPETLKVEIVADGTQGAEIVAVERLFKQRLSGFDLEVRQTNTIERQPSGKAVLVENRWLRQ